MGNLVGRRTELEDALVGLNRAGGAVFTGEAGVGKTHLLNEVAARSRRSGWHLEVLRASPATSGIPMWPFFHVLPGSPPADRDELIRGIRTHFDDEARGDRLLLVIDDAQHLDDDSAILVHHLASERPWRVLATVRDGEPVADAWSELASLADVVAVEVGPLAGTEADELVAAVVGGPCSPELAAAVSDAAGGNPLLIREVLLDAVDAGGVVERDGLWWPAGTGQSLADAAGARTVRLIDRRIGRLDQSARRLLDLVAVAGMCRVERVPVHLRSSLDTLVGRHLLDMADDGSDGRTITFDHPIVGEAVLQGMSEVRRWAALRELVESVRTADRWFQGDATRLATWAEALGTQLDATEWVAAARESVAAFNADAALSWARAALDADPGAHAAHRVLGKMFRLRGELDAAAAAFGDAAATAIDEDDIASTAIDRAGLVGFQMGEPAEAVRILHEAADRVEDPVRAGSLRSEAGIQATLLGRFEDVLLSTPTDRELEVAEPSDRWLIATNEVYARTMLGRVDDIARLVDTATSFFPAVVGERPHELDLVLGLRGAARIERGEFTLGIDELQPMVSQRLEHGEYCGIMAAVLALLLDGVGAPTAGAVAAQAIAQHEWMDPYGSGPIAVASAALAAASQGDHSRARALADGARDAFAGSEPWTSIWIGRAEARNAWHDGLTSLAVERCVEAGRVALDTNHLAYGAVALHDGVLYGGVDEVLPLLRKAVEPTEACTFLELLLRHAAAVADEALDDLAHCAERFAELGAVRLGVDVRLQQASALSKAGELMRARRADAVGRHLAAAAGVMPTHPPTIDDALSDRELEVAAHAAAGSSSRDIGEAAFLSVRTVDNHLRNVYRKLGLDGRDDLAGVFAPPPSIR